VCAYPNVSTHGSFGNRRCATCYRSRFETMCFGMNEAGSTHCQHEPCGRAPQSECGWSIIVPYDELPPVCLPSLCFGIGLVPMRIIMEFWTALVGATRDATPTTRGQNCPVATVRATHLRSNMSIMNVICCMIFDTWWDRTKWPRCELSYDSAPAPSV
jgi:hypothetical protein